MVFNKIKPIYRKLRQSRFCATIGQKSIIGLDGTIENIRNRTECIEIGENSFIRGRLLTYRHGGAISIGDWCYIGARTEIWSMQKISIGNRVLISHDVNIHDGTAHSTNPIERHLHYKEILTTGPPVDNIAGVESAPVVIEDDVWISFGVTVLKGVRIGKGSIIGANALVTQDVPSHHIYINDVVPVVRPIK